MIIPIAILNKEEDSLPFFAQLLQNFATIVANIIIKNALMDWNMAAGTSFPMNGNEKASVLSVFLSLIHI